MLRRRWAALTLLFIMLFNMLTGAAGYARASSVTPSPSPTPAPSPTPSPTPVPVTHRNVTLVFSGDTVLGMTAELHSMETGALVTGVVGLDTEIDEPAAAFDNVEVGGWSISVGDYVLEPAEMLLSNAGSSDYILEVTARKPIPPALKTADITVYLGSSAQIEATGLPAPKFLLLTQEAGIALSETGTLSAADSVAEGEYKLAVSAYNGIEPSAEALLTVKVVSDNTDLKSLSVRGADMDVELDIGFDPKGNRFEAALPEGMHGVRVTAETFGLGTVGIYGYGRLLSAELPIALYMGETALTLDITASDGVAQRTVTLLLRRGSIRRPAVTPRDITSPRLYSGSASRLLLRTFAQDESGPATVKWQVLSGGAFKDIPGANAPYVMADMPGGISVLRVIAYDAAGNLRVSGHLYYDGGPGAGGEVYARTQHVDARGIALLRAELRSEPSYTASRLSRVYRGDALRLRGMAGAFLAVEHEGRVSYIHASHAALADPEARIDAVAIRPARLLSRPNQSYASAGRAQRGQTVRVARIYGDYAYVETEGASGYILLRHLRTCAAF